MNHLWLPCFKSNRLPMTPVVSNTSHSGRLSLLAALMMIDMNGPDTHALDEVKALILESVNEWKNYKNRCRH